MPSTKNLSPRQLASFTAGILSVPIAIGILILTQNWRVGLASLLVVFAGCYWLISVTLERFIYRKIKLIYKLIYQTNGTIRIKELNEKLFISPSPFEKRFRKVVGTTAKKFASIVRFNSVLDNLNESKTLTEICYENNFFDQAHFIKDFKQFTGDTPENFKRFL